jgi:hypothetical protein
MVSEMAIGGEVFGSCVEGIEVSVEVENSETPYFAVSGVPLDLFGREKGLKICVGGGRWCQVLDAVWGFLRVIVWCFVEGVCVFRVIEKTSSPSVAGACGDRLYHLLTIFAQYNHCFRTIPTSSESLQSPGLY